MGALRSLGPPASPPGRFRILVVVLVVLVVLSALASICLGATSVSLANVGGSIAHHVGLAVGAPDAVDDRIVWTIRVPRTLLAVVVGAALAVSGVAIQCVVRNPLGDPYLIGILPGASLGAVAVIVIGGGALGGLSLSAAAFVGALAAFAVVFLLGRQNGHWPPTRLVLAGVAVGYLISSVTYFLQVLATPNEVQRVLFWSLGSVAGADWHDLAIPSTVTIVVLIVLLSSGQRLNALSSGTDLAATLGVNVARFQLLLMVITAVASGAVVAVAGGIGFVGLIVPHLTRLLVGADHRRVLIAAPLLGAAFLPMADIVARFILAPAEVPIGVVTAAVGAPFFLWLLSRSGGRRVVPRRRRSTSADDPAVSV